MPGRGPSQGLQGAASHRGTLQRIQGLSSRAPAAAKCALGNSYGNEYSTAPIGDGLRAQDGLEEPIYFWVPSIAPSGMLFYTGDLFPEWQGNLFVGSLVAQHLTRLVLDGDRVVAEERLLVERGQRIRDVRQGPDGAIYLLTSIRGPGPSSAEVLKITPN